jgi:hypothetical protein
MVRHRHVVAGMARQGFDLQLTRYDDRGWSATFYTTGMEHSPTSATGHREGAHAVARDAAGRVAGGETDVDLPCGARDLRALKLPGREASLVKLIAGQSKGRILSSELDLHHQLVALHRLATHTASQSAPTMSLNNAISGA